MKCPKCGYLGFEAVDRCRNCGYEFSLASSAPVPDLPLRRDAPNLTALDDLTILDRPAAPPARSQSTSPQPVQNLFGDDDRPLITRPSPPRPPLAVRRSTPEVPRLRAEQPRMQTLDLE